MEKIKPFFKKNWGECLLLLSLAVIFMCTVAIYKNFFGSVIIDCGREAYLSQQVLNGKILYKDIFNLFGPFSYQFNAFLYSIFGINLDVLRFAGIICALLSMFSFYTLTRFFSSKEISWVITIFIIFSCIFHPGIFNYIFPYSFALIYSLCSLLLSACFLIFYLKNNNAFLIFLSWFFAGVCFASKNDYFLYIIALFIITLICCIKKKLNFVALLINFVGFLFTPTICFGLLFLNGLSLTDLLHHAYLIKKLTLTTTNYYFYANYVGVYPTEGTLDYVFRTFGLLLPLMTTLFISLYFLIKSLKKTKKTLKKIIICLIFINLSLYSIYSYFTASFFYAFSWVPIFTFCLLLFILYEIYYNKRTYYNKLYPLLIIIALSVSIKTFFFLSLDCYGPYSLPLLLIVDSIFLVEYLPEYFKAIDKKILKKTFTVFVILLVFFSISYIKSRFQDYQELASSKGKIYDSKKFILPIKNVIDYIQKNAKSEDKVWMIPEGMMVNFMTNHDSNGLYFSIIPPFVETFGAKKILEDTKKQNLKYIIISNRTSDEYSAKYICINYGRNLCKWIEQNYNKEKTFKNDDFVIKLYQKK